MRNVCRVHVGEEVNVQSVHENSIKVAQKGSGKRRTSHQSGGEGNPDVILSSSLFFGI